MSEPTTTPSTYRCPRCRGTNVQMLMWVELSTGRVVEDDYDGEVFCPTCDATFRFSMLVHE